jgi:hypothetical protein
LTLKIGAKVMVIYNVDTADSLTNGAMGEVKGFIRNTKNEIVHILIDFFDDSIGKHMKHQYKHLIPRNLQNCVPITRVSFTYSLGSADKGHISNVKGLQFTLKLAYATTAHKIQGQTVKYPNKMVADLKHVFACGQSYVILSRIQSLTQLYLIEFNPEKIMTDELALEETARMKIRSINLANPPWSRHFDNKLKVLTLNIRSLRKHLPDLTSHPLLMESDILCLTETHLGVDEVSNTEIVGYTQYLASLGKGKGVCVYIKNSLSEVIDYSCVQKPDFQIINIKFKNYSISCVYRSSSVLSNLKNIYNVINQTISYTTPVLICGDFNTSPENSLTNDLCNHGIQQMIKFPTHEHGNILDHVYTNVNNEFQYYIHPVHFSDHDAILSLLPIRTK